MLDLKLLQLEKVHTDDNFSDMLTKTLSRDKHLKCRNLAGMVDVSTKSIGGELLGYIFLLEFETQLVLEEEF